MDEPYVKDFFTVNRFLLRCAGFWAPENKTKLFLVLYRIYGILTFLIVNIFFLASEFVSLKNTYGNVYDLLKNVGIVLTHFLGTCKVLLFYGQGHKIIEITNILESKEFHYEACTERGFFPGLTSKKFKRIGFKYTLVFVTLAHFTLLSSFLPLATYVIIFMCKKPSQQQDTLNYKLPYHCTMPFEYNTPMSFLVAMSYQCYAMFSFVYSVIGFDTLFMNIMNCVGFNLRVIQGAFLTIRERAIKHVTGPICDTDNLYNSEELKLLVRNDIKKINRHLQTMYNVCQDLENIYKYVSLAQIMATLFILSSSLYLISSTPFSRQFFNEIFYILTISFQLVAYCWFGNEVTLQADKMPLYIWQCDWLTADDNFKKSMILTMTRAEKPLFLTAGDFVPLTLSTLMSILKGSYSFFTVIKGTSE